jgi:hypothetical protein
MATFEIPDLDVAAWGTYGTETASRVDEGFTISAFKNVNKNYKKKVKCCNNGRVVLIAPGECPTSYLTIQPDSETCPTTPVNHACYQTFTVDPDVGTAGDYVCVTAPPVEQIPFALASRGIVFRNRNVPYFVSAGGTKTFMDEVIS